LDAAPPPENPETSSSAGRGGPARHGRRAAIALLAIAGAGLVVLVSASIVNELLGNRPHRGATPVLTPAEIASCRRDVATLLERLVREAARVQEAPLEGRGDGAELGRRWDAFGSAWDESWREVDARCRFGELAETGLGRGYDRAAWVHRSLPRTRLKVGHQLARFARDLADEVAGMRRALEEQP
jgi:hypothetical protein